MSESDPLPTTANGGEPVSAARISTDAVNPTPKSTAFQRSMTVPRLVLPPLPVPLTSFIGRESLAASATDILGSDQVRLLTLTGPGGVGKTRLALHVAAALNERFPDGIGFISLADVRDPALVLPTIAFQLGLQEGDRYSLLERVCAQLGVQSSLLVLDNFEQVVSAAPILVDLLHTCPEVSLLITSRSPLHVSGEQVLPVEPLSLPLDGAEVIDSEAVQLFLTRAESVRPDLTATEATSPAIAEICRRLDGLPLAIELAAVRAALLPPPVMLDRLRRRLPVLSSGPRDQPARLQTMHNAIAWSYDLLSAEEQRLFRCLSAFVGGISLAAAAAVAELPDSETLARLEVLVDHNLVRAVADATHEPRYAMFEAIREFGLSQLAGTGEEDAVRQHHARFFLDLVERIGPELEGANATTWLARLDLDRSNVQATLNWLVLNKSATDAMRVGTAMWGYWRIRGHLSGGQDQLARAVTLAGDDQSSVRAEALWKLGYLEFYLGEFNAAKEHLEASIQLFDAIGDLPGVATANDSLGMVLRMLQQPERALHHHKRALAIRRSLGDRVGEEMPIANIAVIALDRGDLELARSLFERALAIARESGSPREVAYRLLNLTQLELISGDFERARELAATCVREFDTLGDQVAMATATEVSGRVEAAAGHLVRASGSMRDSLHLRLRMGLLRDLTGFMECIAGIIVSIDPALAVKLLGAANADRATTGLMRLHCDEEAWLQAADVAKAAIGEDAFADALRAGQAMRPIAASRLALDAMNRMTPAGAEANDTAIAGSVGSGNDSVLTPREIEVLRLVAIGHTNRSIAATLFISPATAKRHVSNILAKLGLPTRAAAVRYALRTGVTND